MKFKLKLNVRQVRAFQEKHGVKNLLMMEEQDVKQVFSVDTLVELVYEGTRYLGDEAPTLESIEEMDTGDLLAAVKGFFSPEDPK